VNGHELTDVVAAPDPCFGRFPAILQVLRRKSNGNERKDMRIVTDARDAINYAMSFQPNSLAQYHFTADDGVWPDVTTLSEACSGGHYGGRVNVARAVS
jgi:hypothetical protein